jgi:hypothetical protein
LVIFLRFFFLSFFHFDFGPVNEGTEALSDLFLVFCLSLPLVLLLLLGNFLLCTSSQAVLELVLSSSEDVGA